MTIETTINGETHRLDVASDRRLSSVLRDDVGLLATKIGCGEGACGACAVLLDGRAVNSCLILAGAVHGRAIVTAEGIWENGTALQAAFHDEDAVQCGFCTPGQTVSAVALLTANPSPTREEIRTAMSGNICRCGTYVKIERAIARAASEGAR